MHHTSQLDALAALFSKDELVIEDIVRVIQCWIDSDADASIETIDEFLAALFTQRVIWMHFGSTDALFAKCEHVHVPNHPHGPEHDHRIEFFIFKRKTVMRSCKIYFAMLTGDLTAIKCEVDNYLHKSRLANYIERLRSDESIFQ